MPSRRATVPGLSEKALGWTEALSILDMAQEAASLTRLTLYLEMIYIKLMQNVYIVCKSCIPMIPVDGHQEFWLYCD